MIPVVKEKIKVKLALTIPTDLPIVLVDEIIDTPLVVALKTCNIIKNSNISTQFFTACFLLINIIDKTIFNLFYFIQPKLCFIC